VEVPPDAFVFSPDPAGSQPWNPDTMTHRYERYASRVGITSSLKELRHYSATQLLSNGVDLRTVAGRLGHAQGATTLRFYAQFARPADQHAASVLSLCNWPACGRRNCSGSSSPRFPRQACQT
jgi:integrase